ncbi:hypothetical protein OUZ56_021000 [Daphnia magna]|uniref:Uncharacterized protein n=1 Tax=Daphnia magna TaxID=35525 RepID=A0ABQ9ZG44_9CRUS|nr:hypothetical protein OUZ56_021000 [Daphnia magna]
MCYLNLPHVKGWKNILKLVSFSLFEGLNCSPFQILGGLGLSFVKVVRHQRMIVPTVSKWILDLLQFLLNETIILRSTYGRCLL